MEQTECSETSAYKLQTPGNYPEESTQHSEHGECLKWRVVTSFFVLELFIWAVHTNIRCYFTWSIWCLSTLPI